MPPIKAKMILLSCNANVIQLTPPTNKIVVKYFISYILSIVKF